ncbi:MAG: transcription elongation factor GreA [Chlamydiae bacterium]|nr:transcription elongation factor GreA [Chlamydiota bacterium]
MPNYMTKKTYERLQARLKHLAQVETFELSKEIAVAREKGDLRENAEYEMAKHKQALVMTEIGELKGKLVDFQFIEDLRVPGDRVSLGTVIQLKDVGTGEEFSYTILGPEDSDADNGTISFQSPLAKGLIGQKAGQEVTVSLPGGSKKIKILSVKPYKI